MMKKFTKEQRQSAWATVYSGNRFYYLEPHADMLDINDIARALSKQCRYNGHLPDIGDDDIFSVAQHAVYVSLVADTEVYHEVYPEDVLIERDELWALHHDDTEYVCGDVISPLKRLNPLFGDIEDGIALVVRDKFNIPFNHDIDAKVHRADYFMYLLEANTMQASIPAENKSPNQLSVGLTDVFPDFYPWPPSEAHDRFLSRHEELEYRYSEFNTTATG